MKTTLALAGLTLTSALSIPTSLNSALSRLSGQEPLGGSTERFLIELSPDDTRWVTEDEKWALRQDGKQFFDITAHQDDPSFGKRSWTQKTVSYPSKVQYNDTVMSLLKGLEKKQMEKHLETFTGFHTRYYKSVSKHKRPTLGCVSSTETTIAVY